MSYLLAKINFRRFSFSLIFLSSIFKGQQHCSWSTSEFLVLSLSVPTYPIAFNWYSSLSLSRKQKFPPGKLAFFFNLAPSLTLFKIKLIFSPHASRQLDNVARWFCRREPIIERSTTARGWSAHCNKFVKNCIRIAIQKYFTTSPKLEIDETTWY